MTKAEQYKEKIEAYFAARRAPVCQKDGSVVTDEHGNAILAFTRPPTVTGLCHALGFSSREKMLQVRDKKCAEAIASALLVIEEYAEEKLFSKESFSGTKLFLSVNFPRWREVSHTECEPFPEQFDAWAK